MNKDYYFIVTLQYHVSIDAESKEEARSALNDSIKNVLKLDIDNGMQLSDEEIKLMKLEGDTWIEDPDQPYEEYINTYDK